MNCLIGEMRSRMIGEMRLIGELAAENVWQKFESHHQRHQVVLGRGARRCGCPIHVPCQATSAMGYGGATGGLLVLLGLPTERSKHQLESSSSCGIIVCMQYIHCMQCIRLNIAHGSASARSVVLASSWTRGV